MFIIPFPEIMKFRKFYFSLSLVLFVSLCHFAVEWQEPVSESYNFTESESNAYLSMQSKLYQRHLVQTKNFSNKGNVS